MLHLGTIKNYLKLYQMLLFTLLYRASPPWLRALRTFTLKLRKLYFGLRLTDLQNHLQRQFQLRTLAAHVVVIDPRPGIPLMVMADPKDLHLMMASACPVQIMR